MLISAWWWDWIGRKTWDLPGTYLVLDFEIGERESISSGIWEGTPQHKVYFIFNYIFRNESGINSLISRNLDSRPPANFSWRLYDLRCVKLQWFFALGGGNGCFGFDCIHSLESPWGQGNLVFHTRWKVFQALARKACLTASTLLYSTWG